MAQPLLARLREKSGSLRLDVLAPEWVAPVVRRMPSAEDRKSTRLNSSHDQISYAVFCLKKKNKKPMDVLQTIHNDLRQIPCGLSGFATTRQTWHSSLTTSMFFFFFNDTATTEIYTLSLHDALPIRPSA